LIIGFSVDSVVKFIGQTITPTPAYLLDADLDTIQAFYLEAPYYDFWYLPVGWVIAALMGAYLSERISDWINYLAGVINILLMIGIASLFLMIVPHPDWSWMAMLFSYLFGGAFGIVFGIRAKQKDDQTA
jgi:hypothetical protein